MDRNDYRKSFGQRLGRSQKAVNAVADFWKREGYAVQAPVPKMAPDLSDAEAYKDSGDVFVFNDNEWWRYEVKGRTLRFTCKDDFPFPTILVCAVDSFEKMIRDNALPVAFITVSADYKHVAWIDLDETRHLWTQGTQRDNERGYSYQAYYVHKKYVTFFPLLSPF
jgi:hypothetical protein